MLRLAPNFFGDTIELRIQFGALPIQLRELAREYNTQLGAHLVAQLGVSFGLGRLALQRVHLPRDFLEDIVHPGQVQFGIFQARLGQPLLGFEFGHARGLFNNRAAIGRTAAQDLSNAPLLDQCIGLRPQTGAHE